MLSHDVDNRLPSLPMTRELHQPAPNPSRHCGKECDESLFPEKPPVLPDVPSYHVSGELVHFMIVSPAVATRQPTALQLTALDIPVSEPGLVVNHCGWAITFTGPALSCDDSFNVDQTRYSDLTALEQRTYSMKLIL